MTRGAPDPGERGSAIIGDLIAWGAERGSRDRARVLAITGPAGVGKTFAANRALAAGVTAGMLVGTGKFAQGQASGYAPIMAALSAMAAAAMRTLFDRQTGVASLADALGVQLDVLIAAGFELSEIAPTAAIEALANRRGSTARITAAVLALLDWLARFDVARVLLIDDWYRASDEVQALFAAIVAAPVAAPLILVLTQRAAPISPGLRVDRIHAIGLLAPDEVRALLEARLGAEAGALAVAALHGSGVAPLPFDVLQAADTLIERGVLRRIDERWTIDGAQFRNLALDAATRIAALDDEVYGVALSLSLWGDRAPVATFRAALGGARVDDAIEGLRMREIVAIVEDHVAFRHDRLRRETLARAGDAERRVAAARLAEGLGREEARGEAQAVALRLRLDAGLDDADPARWRDAFARGATAARNRGDAAAADGFAEAALTLHDRAPALEAEALRLILREALIAAANRDDPATDARARALIATAASPTDVYRDHEIGVVALRLAGRGEEAWRLAGEGLRRAGLRPPPARPGVRTILSALAWRHAPRRRSGFDGNEEADAFTGMAAAAAHLAYHRDPRGTAIIGFDASRRSGRAFARSPYWRSVDAFLFAAMGDRAAAAAVAEQAVAQAAQQRVYRAATLYQATFFGLHWRHPIRSQRPRYREIVEVAQLEGDLVTAAYAWRIHIMAGWRGGLPLAELAEDARVARQALRDLGEESFCAEMDAMAALLAGLSGRTGWDPAVWRRDIPTRNHVIDLELSNLAGDWEETVRRAEALEPLWGDYAIQADSVPLCFHEALARLRTGRPCRRSALRFLREAARLNPADHAGKLHLIEAETLRRKRRPAAILAAAYHRAVAAAEASGSRLDAGLTLVVAADALREVGDHHGAERCRRRAEAVWRDWGLRAELHLRPAVALTRDDLAEAEARAAAAERADTAKSRLLAHVGHELRTPLQTLQAVLDVSAQTREPVDMADVRTVLGSLSRLVDDLDVIGGLADPRDAKATERVDLVALVRSEIALLRHAPIAFASAGEAVPVTVAADRVRQIVRNLLSNAVKYGGGAVDVMLSFQREEAGVLIALAVADRGPGISDADRETIFIPFERGACAGDGRGAGLGLALSRQLAERLGGTLRVEDRAGGGARFVLGLVLAEAECRAIAAMPLGVAPGCRRILLVEDAPSVRRLLATVLAGLGYRVQESGDAAQALAAWRARPADLAIVDLGLPDASGLDVLAQIRATSRETPVILLSAAMTGEAAAAARTDPRVRALCKPASAESLQAVIAELFGAEPGPCPGQPDPATDPLYIAARAEVSEQARAAIADHATATPQVLHRLAGTAAQFGWLSVATAVEAFAVALADDVGIDAASVDVLAALEAMA